MNTLFWLLPLAIGLDLLVGDPVYRLHPVRLMGHAITAAERGLRVLGLNGLIGGVILALGLPLCSGACYLLIRLVWIRLSPGTVLIPDLFAVYSCIALRDLIHHALPVIHHLDTGDLPRARQAVAGLVGRDVTVLDNAGVARAAVESVAEGFLDGFLGPVFWFILAALLTGSPVIATMILIVYRAVNTLDSMVGYRNERYEQFGKCSARLDDILNFLPARLSPFLMWPAALLAGLDANSGWRITWRDRLKHESPNSAHTESFAAGALGLRLGGPTRYADGLVEKPWLGDNPRDAGTIDIRRACRLVLATGLITVVTGSFLLYRVNPADILAGVIT